MGSKGVLRVADFFCGAGGFSEGFRQIGFDVVFALDNWKPAVDTHKLNHPKCKNILQDILELNTPKKIDDVVPDVGIIIGSPPCVSFSGSNKAGKADKSLGIKLIEAYLRIIAWKKKKGSLKYWILENVPNASGHIKERYTWKELGLPGKGPDLTMQQRIFLDASKFGAPQARKRFFCGDFLPPKENHKHGTVTVRHVLNSIRNPLLNKIPAKVYDPVYGYCIEGKELTDHFYDTTISEFEWKKSKRLKQDHGYMGKMEFPENLDRPSRTVMATRSASTRESMIFEAVNDKGNHVGYRLPTIREIASLMSFPISYQFEAGNESSKYKLIGNAVCPKIAQELAKSIASQEGLNIPKHFVPLKLKRPSFDLTGSQNKLKQPKPKRLDSKFALHIPNLKIKSFRVELNNLDSDFSNNKIVWSCVLHKGTGKNALKLKIKNHKIYPILKSIPPMQTLIEEVEKRFSEFNVTPGNLQKSYCQNSTKNNPESILDTIKEIIDRHLPDKGGYHLTDVRIKSINGPIPMRILAGLFACNYFVNKLK